MIVHKQTILFIDRLKFFSPLSPSHPYCPVIALPQGLLGHNCLHKNKGGGEHDTLVLNVGGGDCSGVCFVITC